MGQHGREELKKAVQIGVMRGVTSNREKRKNSRLNKLMNGPEANQSYQGVAYYGSNSKSPPIDKNG